MILNFKNVDELNVTRIDYFGDLTWDNGSKLEGSTNWDSCEKLNLTSTVTKIDQTDTMVLLTVPISQAKGLRSHTKVHLTQKKK